MNREHRWFPGMDELFDYPKLARPLFAVQAIIAANTERVFHLLQSWVHQYESAPQSLVVRDRALWRKIFGEDARIPNREDWGNCLRFRQPIVPGMLLNSRELAGLAHVPLPNVPSERLLRTLSQTRRAPRRLLETPAIVIGENAHRGESRPVAIPPDVRARHCYIAGASGTGKSTLLLNMLLADAAAGHGVGLLDPHGDLVRDVLARLPEERLDDVSLATRRSAWRHAPRRPHDGVRDAGALHLADRRSRRGGPVGHLRLRRRFISECHRSFTQSPRTSRRCTALAGTQRAACRGDDRWQRRRGANWQ